MPWRRISCLMKHHATKTCGKVDVQLHAFLTSALGGSEWPASRPGRFNPWVKVPRAGLDAAAETKRSHHRPYREFNLGRSARSLISMLTELPCFPWGRFPYALWECLSWSRNSPPFTEPEGLVPISQELATGPLEPDESSPRPVSLYIPVYS
jgi:hypothetical protein